MYPLCIWRGPSWCTISKQDSCWGGDLCAGEQASNVFLHMPSLLVSCLLLQPWEGTPQLHDCVVSACILCACKASWSVGGLYLVSARTGRCTSFVPASTICYMPVQYYFSIACCLPLAKVWGRGRLHTPWLCSDAPTINYIVAEDDKFSWLTFFFV